MAFGDMHSSKEFEAFTLIREYPPTTSKLNLLALPVRKQLVISSTDGNIDPYFQSTSPEGIRAPSTSIIMTSMLNYA